MGRKRHTPEQIMAHQDVVHRLPRRQRQLRTTPLQVPPNLLRPEVLELPTYLEDRLHYLRWCYPGTSPRSARSVLQARWPSLPPSIHPLVASLTTNPVSIAHRSKATNTAMGFLDKPLSLFHDMSLRERHRPPPVGGADCNPCPFTYLYTMSLYRTGVCVHRRYRHGATGFAPARRLCSDGQRSPRLPRGLDAVRGPEGVGDRRGGDPLYDERHADQEVGGRSVKGALIHPGQLLNALPNVDDTLFHAVTVRPE